MKHYVAMELVIISYTSKDIITTSGDNEKMTSVSEFFEGFSS